jgi:hypothetical protein
MVFSQVEHLIKMVKLIPMQVEHPPYKHPLHKLDKQISKLKLGIILMEVEIILWKIYTIMELFFIS